MVLETYSENVKEPCCNAFDEVLDGGPGLILWHGGESLGDEFPPGVYIVGCDSCMNEVPVRFCPFCGKALS